RDNTKDISFTIPQTELQTALDVLNSPQDFTAKNVTYRENVAKVSVVGAGMVSNPGVAAKVFEAMYNANVNIKMISTSEISISVLVNEEDADRAMRYIHDIFDLAD
ncbi:MAG: ACT domain-containing protein, partial [Lachnospiraceae bacterium]|nr:ACT domain-containing protein [Lachnospiraceae bacterium]